MSNPERIKYIMIEKMITPKIIEYIVNYLETDTGRETYVNIFNSGIIINISVIKKLIRDKGINFIEHKIENFIKDNF